MTRLRRKLKKSYYNNKRKKIYIIIILIIIFIILKFINSFFTFTPNYEIKEVSDFLGKYFSLEEKYQIEWYYFASIDDLENKLEETNDNGIYEKLNSIYL